MSLGNSQPLAGNMQRGSLLVSTSTTELSVSRAPSLIYRELVSLGRFQTRGKCDANRFRSLIGFERLEERLRSRFVSVGCVSLAHDTMSCNMAAAEIPQPSLVSEMNRTMQVTLTSYHPSPPEHNVLASCQADTNSVLILCK